MGNFQFYLHFRGIHDTVAYFACKQFVLYPFKWEDIMGSFIILSNIFSVIFQSATANIFDTGKFQRNRMNDKSDVTINLNPFQFHGKYFIL